MIKKYVNFTLYYNMIITLISRELVIDQLDILLFSFFLEKLVLEYYIKLHFSSNIYNHILLSLLHIYVLTFN